MSLHKDPGEMAATAATLSSTVGSGPFEKEPEPDPEENVEVGDPLLNISHESPLLSHVPVESFSTFYGALRLGPLTAVFCLAVGMLSPVWVELLKNRVCLEEFKYSPTVCANINEDQYKEEGDAVRSKTADYQLYDTLIACTPAVFFSIFVGAWSDRFGRKLPMLAPLVGMTLSVLYTSIMGHFTARPTFFLISSALGSLTGGWTIFLAAQFSYIGDHSSIRNRSINIVIIEVLINISVNAGSFLGGFLHEKLGGLVPLYIITVLYALCFVYVVVVIRDHPRHKLSLEPKGFAGLFTLNSVKANIRMLKMPRFGDTRLHIWIVFLSLTVFQLVASGDTTIMQLFAEFNPIEWDLISFTEWSAITGFITSFLAVVVMLILRKSFHIHDTLIGCLAVLSALLAYFVYGIAWTGWMLYLGAFLGLLKVLMYVSVRSLMSTMVDPDEIGKSMSLISSMQSITAILGALIYTDLFARTSYLWPGLCFIAAAYTLVPVFAAMGYVDVARRRDLYNENYENRPLST